jgi:hypothetical protein
MNNRNYKDGKWEFLGLMGMCEMENAVEYMVNKARDSKIPFSEIIVHPGDDGIDDSVAIGFWHLLMHGWMESRYPNCSFSPNQDLQKRVVERCPDVGPVGPTFSERMDKFFEDMRANHVKWLSEQVEVENK